MAKDRDSAERAEKKEKKEKKKREKELLAAAGENGVKKSKKDKKDKKSRRSSSLEDADPGTVAAVLETVAEEKPKKVKVQPNGDVAVTTSAKRVKTEDAESDDEHADRMDVEVKVKKEALPGALVPFAKPLADEKNLKKALKGVKRATKKRALKRGVKEVVKSLRKTGEEEKNKPNSPLPFAVVVIAGDVSPIDVISHLPVLCEDYNVPYIFVPSRAELGAASSTKRPTSVVMICRDVASKIKKEVKDDDEGDSWEDTYKDLVKMVQKADKERKIY